MNHAMRAFDIAHAMRRIRLVHTENATMNHATRVLDIAHTMRGIIAVHRERDSHSRV